MRVELLSFEGCPHVTAAQERIRLALAAERVSAEIHQIEVGTSEDAERLQFLGSPSVRIDGIDVEPEAATRESFGLMCRTYRDGKSLDGAPAVALIRSAIRKNAMNVTGAPNETRDILGNRLVVAAVFWLPALAIVVGGFFNMGQGWRSALWCVALTTMGVGCVVNAFRCGRVHCYATGPFFLVMALVSVLYGVGVVSLGEHGWNIIGLAVLIGAVALCCLPEFFFGRYRRARGVS